MKLHFHKKLFILTAILFSLSGFAGQRKLDSLKQYLGDKWHDTIRLKAYYKIGKEYSRVSSDSALLWFTSGLNYSEALLQKKQGEKETKAINGLKGFFFTALGNIYFGMGKPDKAMDFYEKSIALHKAMNNNRSLCNAYGNAGLLYAEEGNFPKALEYYQLALTLSEQTDYKSVTSSTLINIGNVYMNSLEDYKRAIPYYEKAVAIQQATDDKEGLAYSFNSLGICYFNQHDTASMFNFYGKAMKLREEIGDQVGIVYSTLSYGTFYFQCKNYGKAMEYFERAAKTGKEVNYPYATATANFHIGSIYYEKKDFKTALRFCNAAMDEAKTAGIVNIIRDDALVMKKIFMEKGDAVNALKMFEIFVNMKDSINNQESQKDITRKEMKYEFGKRMAADSIKTAEEKKVTEAQLSAGKAKLKQERTQFWYLVGGLVFVAVGMVFFIQRLRITKKQKKIIELQKAAADRQREEVIKQKDIIEEKQKEILDSIKYAKRIQQALITSEWYVERNLNKLNDKK